MQCVSQCCGGLVFSLYDQIQIVHCPPFPLKQQWHTEVILSAQRHVLFNDKPMYLQCVHLPHCILCATQIHTKLGNVLVVSISQYFWQRLDTKKRNLPALFSSSKHWLLHCLTGTLIFVNQRIHKYFLSRWKSADLQHGRRPGFITWADKLNRGSFWWKYYSSHGSEWNFPKWEQGRKIKQTRQWNNYLKISSFLAHWQMECI